jgi:hypothetical protein
VDAAAKERPEEAPFAALRPHDYRLRTWNRTPAAKPTRPDNKKNYLFFLYVNIFSNFAWKLADFIPKFVNFF